MNRGPPFADANANPYIASQMQHVSAQRLRQNSSVNNFPGQPDSFSAEEDRQYASKKSEEPWHWDRDAQQMSPQLYGDGQGGNASRSFIPNQIADTKLGSNHESRVHPSEQDMEIGYAVNPGPQRLEGLEQMFQDDIMKLMKEQFDAEDAENARHKEKIIEINKQYEENLSALRIRHATRRGEILLKECQSRLQQYQLAGMSHHQNNSGPSDVVQPHHIHGYGGGAPGPVPGEPQREYGSSGHFDSFRQHPNSFGRGRMQGAVDTRVPTPGGGRVYNTGPRFY